MEGTRRTATRVCEPSRLSECSHDESIVLARVYEMIFPVIHTGKGDKRMDIAAAIKKREQPKARIYGGKAS
jgi:hypothetical protein